MNGSEGQESGSVAFARSLQPVRAAPTTFRPVSVGRGRTVATCISSFNRCSEANGRCSKASIVLKGVMKVLCGKWKVRDGK